jgi:hypothetical protein
VLKAKWEAMKQRRATAERPEGEADAGREAD